MIDTILLVFCYLRSGARFTLLLQWTLKQKAVAPKLIYNSILIFNHNGKLLCRECICHVTTDANQAWVLFSRWNRFFIDVSERFMCSFQVRCKPYCLQWDCDSITANRWGIEFKSDKYEGDRSRFKKMKKRLIYFYVIFTICFSMWVLRFINFSIAYWQSSKGKRQIK